MLRMLFTTDNHAPSNSPSELEETCLASAAAAADASASAAAASAAFSGSRRKGSQQSEDSSTQRHLVQQRTVADGLLDRASQASALPAAGALVPALLASVVAVPAAAAMLMIVSTAFSGSSLGALISEEMK